MDAFQLFLRYRALARQFASYHGSRAADATEPIADAVQQLTEAQRVELVGFIDRALETVQDDKKLAGLFDDGNSYVVWKSAEAPRMALRAIREAAQAKR